MTREEFWKGLMLEASAIADMRKALRQGYDDAATLLKLAQIGMRETTSMFKQNRELLEANQKTLTVIKQTNTLNIVLMIIGVSMTVLNLVLLVIR